MYQAKRARDAQLNETKKEVERRKEPVVERVEKRVKHSYSYNNVNKLFNGGISKLYMIFTFFQAKVNIIMENTGRLLQQSHFFFINDSFCKF